MVPFNFKIEYITTDKSVKYELFYICKPRLQYYRRNKRYPHFTQCIVFCNGLMIGFTQAVRCECDEHNPIFAFKLVTKKAMELIKLNFIKDALLTELDKALKSLTFH